MNTATLKIDSFAGRNIVLLDGKPVAMNSEFMNYYSKPIVSIAEKLLGAIESAYNDDFCLNVYGNKFEQKLLAHICSELSFCSSCNTFDTAINLSTRERLLLLKDILTEEPVKLSLCSDDIDVSLPEYPGISFTENENERVVVSNDMGYIINNITQATPVAFVLNGESKKVGKTYIIGVTEDDYKDVINAYIDTMYINPIIYKIFQSTGCNISDECILARIVEPYFYANNRIALEVGESKSFAIKSVPADIDGSGLVFDYDDSVINIENNVITGISDGTSKVCVYYESPIPVVTIDVPVVTRNKAQFIELSLPIKDDVLCVGTTYDLTVNVIPQNADNIDELVVYVSDESVAAVENGNLIVKNIGTFELFAKVGNVEASRTFEVRPKIKTISLSEIPKKIYVGDVFEIQATVSPENAYNGNYKWVTTDNSVAFVGTTKDGKTVIKATGVGDTVISCIAMDDSSVSASIEVIVDSTFAKNKGTDFFLTLGAFCVIFGPVLEFLFGNGNGTITWAGLAIAAPSLVISLFTSKKKWLTLLFVVATIISILIKLL